MQEKFTIIDMIDTHPDKILPAGMRIIKTPYNHLYSFAVGETFNSITELKKKSKLYNSLLKTNAKRARLITDYHYILKPQSTILVPRDNGFDEVSGKILIHSLYGEFNKNENLIGIHLKAMFEKQKIRIKQIIKQPNNFGVYQAIVEKFDATKNEWITKKDLSSFFPDHWSLNQFMFECHHAFVTKIKINEKEYTANTLSGIPVKIILISKNELKSIYPIM